MTRNEPQIEFILDGKVAGVAISPTSIGLARFNEFNQEVERFIAGSDHSLLDEVRVSIGAGSYKLSVFLPVLLAGLLEHDLQALQREDSLSEIDPKRAKIVAKWQSRVQADSALRYEIRPLGMAATRLEFSKATKFRFGELSSWVKVEKYLFGTVIEVGGARRAKIHIRLEDTGHVVTVAANQSYLKDQRKNRLYHKALIRVQAEQRLGSKELRNPRLLSIEDYEPKYDEAALDRFAEQGRKLWADVPDAAEWVRKLRGGE